jgi:hypothetical protein
MLLYGENILELMETAVRVFVGGGAVSLMA